MKTTKIVYEVQEKVGRLSLNSPENLNSFDETMLDDIVNALNEAENDPEVKVIIFDSTTNAFSGGGDIKAMYHGFKEETLDFTHSITKMASVSKTMKEMSKPVICSVDGPIAGAGFNVVLAADLVVAADTAVFTQAFVNIGLIPDAGGLYLLTRAVGVNKALELALLGERVSAVEAQRLGFVTKLTTSSELVETTIKLARQLSFGPSESYKEIKRLVYESEFKEFDSFVQEEIISQTRCGESKDFKEGIFAFVEKRKPVFK